MQSGEGLSGGQHEAQSEVPGSQQMVKSEIFGGFELGLSLVGEI